MTGEGGNQKKIRTLVLIVYILHETREMLLLIFRAITLGRFHSVQCYTPSIRIFKQKIFVWGEDPRSLLKNPYHKLPIFSLDLCKAAVALVDRKVLALSSGSRLLSYNKKTVNLILSYFCNQCFMIK